MSPAAASAHRCAVPRQTLSAQRGQQLQRSSSERTRTLKSRSFSSKSRSASLPKIYLNYKSYLERKTMSKLHKTFESFLTRENTREKLPQGPLQSGIFAVNCMYQKDGAAQSAPFQRMEQGIPAENLEEYGMLELLLGTIRRLCATGYQGIRVTSCGRVLHRP